MLPRRQAPATESPSPPSAQPIPVRETPIRPSRKSGWIIAAAVVAAMLAFLYWQQAAGRQTRPVVAEVPTATVRQGPLDATIRLTGSTAAANSAVLLTPRMSGSRAHGGGMSDFHLVLQRLVPPGSQVRKGDEVASFDRQHMLLRLDDFQANVFQHERYQNILYAQLEV